MEIGNEVQLIQTKQKMANGSTVRMLTKLKGQCKYSILLSKTFESTSGFNERESS